MRGYLARSQFVIGGVLLIVGALVMLLVLVTTVQTGSAAPARVDSTASLADGSGVLPVLQGLAGFVHLPHLAFHPHVAAIGPSIVNGISAFGYATLSAVGAVGHAGFAAGLFVLRLPITISRPVVDGAIVGDVLRPAAATPAPVIKPMYLQLAAVTKPVASVATAVVKPAQPAAIAPSWPIHGTITTLFGAPDWPYEAVHTGIDISDGWRSGVTPIHPFKPGRVIDVEHSGGLGNHVTVDHGGGMTSIYGHMATTNVTVGEAVDESSVLGTEGSTGASTGTHLHFEIRINNSPVNPMLYIPGRP